MGMAEGAGERNLQYFQCQKLPLLQTFLQERGILKFFTKNPVFGTLFRQMLSPFEMR